jgi:hypothetical protein
VKEDKLAYKRDICQPMFITALVSIVNPWNQYTCSTISEWIMKICNGVLFTHKNCEIILFAGRYKELGISY